MAGATFTSLTRLAAAGIWLLIALPLPAEPAAGDDGDSELIYGYDPATGKRVIPNARCLKCHGDENEKTDVRDDGSVVEIYVPPHDFEASVHGDQLCTDCHTTIRRVPHREAPEVIVGCVECHRKAFTEHQDKEAPAYARLGVVVEQIDSYLRSVHARPSLEDQSRTNATCYDCHDGHRVGALGSQQRAEYRLENPQVCGRCHEAQLADYRDSDHGRAVLEQGDSESAVCSDCHTSHEIDSPEGDPVMLTITDNCGNCHEDAQKTYRASYHGQVNTLGYTHSAKCFDCHGGHDVRGEDDPASAIHVSNRLETCRTCHADAPESFLGFHAHADTDDFAKNPLLWITAKLMQALIIGVLAFFWVHVILWMVREYLDRRAGKSYAHPRPGEDVVYFRRFGAAWRWIHLLFALSTMVLVLSGTSLIFAHTAWAKTFIDLLGGPQVEAILHRTAAVVWLGVFLLHLAIVTYNIWRTGRSFQWFGPTSMLPNLQDLRDVVGMFKWFFGRGERPDFDRYSYWQKFDYWAPFWGAAVIGFSGLILFFPTKTAVFMPGETFNIATIVHAEEALLATMFLFTVHYFNSHFRPDRFPMSTIMFTGAVPLEEFKFEHRLEYERLKASGELERHLIRPPTPTMEKGSRLLTAVLILAGLGLLTLVLIGYVTIPH
jgi:cytochrome b subunit of formate dehydrogenase